MENGEVGEWCVFHHWVAFCHNINRTIISFVSKEATCWQNFCILDWSNRIGSTHKIPFLIRYNILDYIYIWFVDKIKKNITVTQVYKIQTSFIYLKIVRIFFTFSSKVLLILTFKCYLLMIQSEGGKRAGCRQWKRSQVCNDCSSDHIHCDRPLLLATHYLLPQWACPNILVEWTSLEGS